MEDTLPHNRNSNMWIGVLKTRRNLDWVLCAVMGLTPTYQSQPLYASVSHEPLPLSVVVWVRAHDQHSLVIVL